ncbi:MAG TPA: tetratricopeptide repeat protein [Candidatus Hydrogenedentes bacterium]|nr:tetratricopeptide repeat protein [Candidatus Hydrogenedentota bacterium]HOC72466.1 tetratricopeptide repeat protein [Candidatus Hydrogenedentota bacterium]HOH49671.1 tetratricopeptide repeat protein [Candidatus Hydrogenedentota bacterium]HQL93294.1 tetratricopeptide repeat protein [Candidatus Hydrogenedentota bacterium]HRZ82359.1 tetratricopeptide repeat protein [Candidatus Hydrogenedentota bacterium]
MARPRKTQTNEHEELIHTPKSEWDKFLAHVMENPWMYAGGVLFVVLCVIAGLAVNAASGAAAEKTASAYAAALTEEDPAKRLELLEGFASDGGRWTAEAVYLAAETAVEADQLDKARELFERVGKDFGKSPYAGRALDGLAFLAEGAGDYQKALELYQRVANEHPEDFLARRKPYDIGRMQEKLGQLKEAADSYDQQGKMFPDSIVAGKASQALDALKAAHPDVFPPEPAVEAAAPAETPAPADAPAVAPAAEAPAAEAPAAPVPAAEAPAAQ